MQKTILYANLEPAERLKAIKNLAVKREERKYERSLEAEEIDKERFEYINEQCVYQDTEEEMKLIYAQYKERLKFQKELLDQRLQTIRTGKKEAFGSLYLIANQATNRMEYYDSNGEVIESRELTSEERQGFLFLGENNDPTYKADIAETETENNIEVNADAPNVFEDAQDVEYEEIEEAEIKEPEAEQEHNEAKPKRKRVPKE